MVVRSCKVTKNFSVMRPFRARSHQDHKVIQRYEVTQDHEVIQEVKKLCIVMKNSCPVLIYGHEVVWVRITKLFMAWKVIGFHEVIHCKEVHSLSRGNLRLRSHSGSRGHCSRDWS